MVDIELTTDTSLNGGSISISLYEDVGDDGTGSGTDPNGRSFDNVATASLDGGNETTTLSGFQGDQGNAYWIRTRRTPSLQSDASPQIRSVSADVPVSGTGGVLSQSITVDGVAAEAIDGAASQASQQIVITGDAEESVVHQNPLTTVITVTGSVPEAVTIEGAAAATTELPDINQSDITLDGPGKLAIDWDDVIDYRWYDIQFKKTAETSWIDFDTVDEDTTTATIENLEDDTEYDVRLRTRTEHVTGDWSTPRTVTIGLAAPDQVVIRLLSYNRAEIGWRGNSDNEDGFRVLVADGEDATSGFTTAETTNPNVRSAIVTNELQSAGHHTFKIEAFNAQSSAESQTASERIYDCRYVLNWRDPDHINQDRFVIYRKRTGTTDAYEQVATVDDDTFRYVTPDLIPNSTNRTQWDYKIVAEY